VVLSASREEGRRDNKSVEIIIMSLSPRSLSYRAGRDTQGATGPYMPNKVDGCSVVVL
jgi:hypothetical protein